MEEKLRLQAQVNELERNVEELGRSRDEFRQAAVQEGAQYVEIVQRASRLEEMGKEERKEWRELKEGMERTIAALKARGSCEKDGIGPIEGVPIVSRHENMDAHIFAAASLDAFEPALKMELTNDPRMIEPTSGPSTSGSFEQKESVEDRQAEIQRLRERCAEVENALRSIRDDSRSMEDFVRTIFDRADSTLQG
jgi:chromosome segregation ATPase